MDPADTLGQLGVLVGRRRLPTALPGQDLVGGAGTDRCALVGQDRTDRLDCSPHPVDRDPVGVGNDELHEDLAGRSSSAAKKPAAAFRISFARRSSRFPLRSLRTSAESRSPGAGRVPVSTSARQTHLRTASVLPTPSFVATDRIASHSGTCSARTSATIRTARSRSSAG